MIKARLVSMILLGALMVCTGSFAQSGSQSSSQQAKPVKKPKVWTNDNIGAVRTPADKYDDQQEANTAQETPAKPPNGQPVSPSGDAASPKDAPKTVQESDQLIAQKQSEITSQQGYLEEIEKEATNGSDADKERLQGRIESRTLYLDRMRSDLSDLQKQRDTLAKQGSDNGSAQDTSAETSTATK